MKPSAHQKEHNVCKDCDVKVQLKFLGDLDNPQDFLENILWTDEMKWEVLNDLRFAKNISKNILSASLQ